MNKLNQNILLEKLRNKAQVFTCSDDTGFECYDGGNSDDTFELGQRDGATLFARYLLDLLEIDYTVEEE